MKILTGKNKETIGFVFFYTICIQLSTVQTFYLILKNRIGISKSKRRKLMMSCHIYEGCHSSRKTITEVDYYENWIDLLVGLSEMFHILSKMHHQADWWCDGPWSVTVMSQCQHHLILINKHKSINEKRHITSRCVLDKTWFVTTQPNKLVQLNWFRIIYLSFFFSFFLFFF